MSDMRKLIQILSLIILPGSLLASSQTADTSLSLFRDGNLSLQDAKLGYSYMSNVISEADYATTVAIQGGFIAYRNQSGASTSHPMGLHQSVDSRSAGVTINQQFATKYSLGVNVGYAETIYESEEEEADGEEFGSVNYGVNASAWFLQETIRLTLSYGVGAFEQIALDTSAGTGERIILPPEVDTASYSARVLQMLTPSTILQYGAGLTKRSDRPDIRTADLEVRQYINAVKGSVQLSGQYYNNVGFLSSESFDGNITAFALNAKLNKKLGEKWIASAGYRFYRELEEARDEFTQSTQRGSDYAYLGGRYRLGDVGWTDAASEVFGQAGYYASNLPSKGIGFSLGVQFRL